MKWSPRSTDLDLTSKFGKYSREQSVIGDKIMYYRDQGTISADVFQQENMPGCCKVYNDIYDADHTSIVLVKKN